MKTNTRYQAQKIYNLSFNIYNYLRRIHSQQKMHQSAHSEWPGFAQLAPSSSTYPPHGLVIIVPTDEYSRGPKLSLLSLYILGILLYW